MDSKIHLRVSAKNIRKSLDISSISQNLIVKIREMTEYKQAKNVLLFYPMKYEINLLDLLDDNKNFYLPKVCGDKLSICPFKKGDKLEKSNLNVCEPCSNSVQPQILDIVFVPALMADKKGYRLGYGGGFYDRFLEAYPKMTSILPIAKELIVEELPIESFDIPVSKVLCF